MSQPPPAVATRPVTAADLASIATLHARVFGPGRYARTAYRVREGHGGRSALCRVAVSDGRIIAALRMTPATVGGRPGAVLLGPLAVDPDFANQGHGRRLIAECVAAAAAEAEHIVVLVGDESYYGRLGFALVPPGQIWLPGPADPARILAHELVPGALAEIRGLVVAR